MKESIAEAIALFSTLDVLEPPLAQAAQLALKALQSGQNIWVCGNGGSAYEAQHLAGELLGRYKQDGRALAAIALNADGYTMSCIANDYRFEDVFSLQIEALAEPGEFVGGFYYDGALPLADVALVVPHPQTNRVQETHQLLLHCLMDRIERGIA